MYGVSILMETAKMLGVMLFLYCSIFARCISSNVCSYCQNGSAANHLRLGVGVRGRAESSAH